MDLHVGYNLPPSIVRRLVLLDWIYDASDQKPGQMVSLMDLFNGQEKPGKDVTAADLREAESEGHLTLHEALGYGGWSCHLTSAGAGFVEEIRHQRGDLTRRRMAARDALLHWLYDCNASGNPRPVTSDISKTAYGTYLGLDFNEQELIDAAVWLLDFGFIKGFTSWGSGVPRPAITPLGQSVAESGRSVNEEASSTVAADAPGAVNITISDSSNVNLAASSPGATQSMTVTADNRNQIVVVADALEQSLPLLGLNEGAASEAKVVVRDLRQMSAEPEPDRGRIKQLLDRASSVAIAGTGSAIGAGIAALAQQALTGLGLG
jgi:hypothetical protein